VSLNLGWLDSFAAELCDGLSLGEPSLFRPRIARAVHKKDSDRRIGCHLPDSRHAIPLL
jgi:hypothetical protein